MARIACGWPIRFASDRILEADLRAGPCRFSRHPNDAALTAEGAVLPLKFGEYRVALIFSALDSVLLAWRMRVGNAVVAAREYDEPDRDLQL